jgi:hypothetical protein
MFALVRIEPSAWRLHAEAEARVAHGELNAIVTALIRLGARDGRVRADVGEACVVSNAVSSSTKP